MLKSIKRKPIIAVIGGSKCTAKIAKFAYDLGRQIAREKWLLVCGGLTGVMENVCRGAKSAGGTTIGILPTETKEPVNPYVDIPIVTAMSYARNAIIVRTGDVVVAIDGSYGTLSEIGLALSCHKPVLGLCTWKIKGVTAVKNVDDMVFKIRQLLK